MFEQHVHKWILGAILALQGLVTPASEAAEDAAFYAAFGDSSEPEPSTSQARSVALQELQRARRVLVELREDSSHAFSSYLDRLCDICARHEDFSGRQGPELAVALHRLASELAFAFTGLEAEIDDYHTWQRVARASEPDAPWIRVPQKFVRRIEVPSEAGDAWSDIDHEIWG